MIFLSFFINRRSIIRICNGSTVGNVDWPCEQDNCPSEISILVEGPNTTCVYQSELVVTAVDIYTEDMYVYSDQSNSIST